MNNEAKLRKALTAVVDASNAYVGEAFFCDDQEEMASTPEARALDRAIRKAEQTLLATENQT